MNTQNPINVQTKPARPARSRRRQWLVGLGAFSVVVLLVAISVAAYAQFGQHLLGRGQVVTPPPVGAWVPVLHSYTVSSLVAAPANPAVVYACAVQSQQATPPGVPPANRIAAGSYTLLRSADFGAHWQDIGSKAGLAGTCEFTINPADENDIYAVSAPGTPKVSSGVLMHSTDGGQTWSAITPTLHLPDLQSTTAWYVLHLTRAGDRLFAIQAVPQVVTSVPPIPVPPDRNFALLRLVTSVDGGYNWTVLDSQLTATQQGVFDYAVDPTHPDTVYELAGALPVPMRPPILPPGPKFSPTPVPPIPQYGSVEALYKTTESGSSWQLLLQGLPFGIQIALAADKPNLVYLGGSTYHLPPIVQPERTTYPGATFGPFHLSMSNDGGASWREVTIPPQVSTARSWFVAPQGQVYADTGMKGPTALPTTTTPLPSSIQSYDPTTSKWSEVTRSPGPGVLLTVTPAGTNGGAVLWFQGTSNGSPVLYRYVA